MRVYENELIIGDAFVPNMEIFSTYKCVTRHGYFFTNIRQIEIINNFCFRIGN